MDEARRVLERLERIEALHAGGAGAAELLGELRALLAEGEAWIAAEGSGTTSAREALDRCGTALAAGDRGPAASRGARSLEEVVAGTR